MMFVARGISVRYGAVEAVRQVSLSVDRGEVVALVGLNGAGKSSLLQAIMGIVPSAEGSITLDGRPMENAPAHCRARHGIAHCPERHGTFPGLSVRDNLRLGGYFRTEADVRVRQSTMYHLFPRLGERAGQVASTLSGGERQMLSLARALMSQPKLLMLDEPSQGLAPQAAIALYGVLACMVRDEGLALLLVEQRPDLLRIPVTRTHRMYAGEFAQDAVNSVPL